MVLWGAEEGKAREKQQRQLQYIRAADGSQAESFDAEVTVGSYSCVGTVAAFGAVAGARVSEVPAVVTQPPLADSPLLNAADVKGGLAVIQRGVVPFVEKARLVQAAEVAAVLFVNSEDKPYVPLGMEGDDDITVPVVCVKHSDGEAIAAIIEEHPGAKASVSYGDAPMVAAGPEEMLTQFFDSCIRQTKMCMEEKDWEGSVLNIKRYVEFRDSISDIVTEEERAVMSGDQVLAMSEVMKDLEIKLVHSLLEVFESVAKTDDVAVMRVYLDLLARLGHAKQCVGTYTAHIISIAEVEFEKMESESYVSALERLLSTRLGLVVKHRPIIRVLCDAMSEAGFAVELLADLKRITDEKVLEITAQYMTEVNIVDMQARGPPWGEKKPDDGLAKVDGRLNEIVMLCQNCVLYNRFFESELKAIDAEWQRRVPGSTSTAVAQRVQETAVQYVVLEQQYLEYGISLAIKRDVRPEIARLRAADEQAQAEEEEEESPQPSDPLLAELDKAIGTDAEEAKEKKKKAAARANSHCSSMVEQVFLLLHKSCMRAISMLSGTASSMLMHHVTAELLAPEGQYCKEMAKRWRRDDDLDDIIVNLNNMATSGVYMLKLKEEITKNAEQLESKDRAQLEHMMGILDSLAKQWRDEVDDKIRGPEGFVRMTGEDFFNSEIQKFARGRAAVYMLVPATELVYADVVKQTEEAEAAQAALHNKLDTVLKNLKKQLVTECFEAAVHEAAIVCAEALEKHAVWALEKKAVNVTDQLGEAANKIGSKVWSFLGEAANGGKPPEAKEADEELARPFTETGAGQLDVDLEALKHFFGSHSGRSLRRCFGRLNQIVALLSVHRVDEVPDVACELLSPPEMQRLLMMRRDLGELSIQRIMEYVETQRAADAEPEPQPEPVAQ